jgi:hypothetical protein
MASVVSIKEFEWDGNEEVLETDNEKWVDDWTEMAVHHLPGVRQNAGTFGCYR